VARSPENELLEGSSYSRLTGSFPDHLALIRAGAGSSRSIANRSVRTRRVAESQVSVCPPAIWRCVAGGIPAWVRKLAPKALTSQCPKVDDLGSWQSPGKKRRVTPWIAQERSSRSISHGSLGGRASKVPKIKEVASSEIRRSLSWRGAMTKGRAVWERRRGPNRCP